MNTCLKPALILELIATEEGIHNELQNRCIEDGQMPMTTRCSPTVTFLKDHALEKKKNS